MYSRWVTCLIIPLHVRNEQLPGGIGHRIQFASGPPLFGKSTFLQVQLTILVSSWSLDKLVVVWQHAAISKHAAIISKISITL